MRETLLTDDYFDTALLFTSPSGDGLKWVIEKTDKDMPHEKYFNAVASYLKSAYGLIADPSGKDLARACYLPCDTHAFLNTKDQ